MAARRKIVIAFDLYGTLLSTESIAKELASHFGQEKATNLAALWRRYQLEYTWRLNSMQQYQPFSDITRNSLRHALADSGLSLDDESIEQVMKAYDSLDTFPDVTPFLKALAGATDIVPVIFSKGTNSMVTNSVQASPDLGAYAGLFRDIVTVEEVECFKPDPRVYYHLAEQMGQSNAMDKMWLVSANPFDVVGATAVRMSTVWVDRGGAGWTDGLAKGGFDRPTIGRPLAVVRGLEDLVERVRFYSMPIG